MKIAIVGCGGVGSIAALALTKGGAEVTAIVRSDYRQVNKHGFHIKSVDYGEMHGFKPAHIASSVEDAIQYGPFDFVVVTTKNTPDVFKVEDLIEPVVSANSVIVLVQNGIGIEDAFFTKFPSNTVLSGVSMISCSNYHGVVEHVGHDELMVGVFDRKAETQNTTAEAKAQQFIQAYKNDHNDCLIDTHVKYTRWRKLVYNGTLNPICALTGVDVGRLELFGGMDLVRKAMDEILAVAAADGVQLPESIKEFMIRSDDGVYYLPSMLVDVRKGNYLEAETLCGNVVRIARKNGVTVPTLEAIYVMMGVVQRRTMEEKGNLEVPSQRPIPQEY